MRLLIGLVSGLLINLCWLQISQAENYPLAKKAIITFFGRAYVVDGDTLWVKVATSSGMKKFRVRLYGLDAPELDTKAGQRAKTELIRILARQGFWVICQSKERDSYKRYVAICFADNNLAYKNQTDRVVIPYSATASLSVSMLRAGYGFAYRRFLTAENYQIYLLAEAEAESKQRGFWADKNFIEQYRRQKRF